MPVTRTATKKPPAAKAAPATRKAPAKATPVKTTRKVAIASATDEPDLLAGMEDASPVADDDDAYDLLSDLTEDNGTAWMPWDEEDQPDGIQGVVKYIGDVDREARFGGGVAPYIEIQDRKDPELLWGVRGYATVLANQLQKALDNGLEVGDIIAIKYFGEVENRKGDNSYKNFKVVTRKGAR